MIQRKMKECKDCGEQSFLFSKGRCKSCAIKAKPEAYQIKPSEKTLNRSGTLARSKSLKVGKRKVTGELELFKKLYEIRLGRCEITGEVIPFSVNSFMHILSKGAYPRLRLNPENIMLVKVEIHTMYDNESKEKLLSKYPAAQIIYDKKDELRVAYYNSIR